MKKLVWWVYRLSNKIWFGDKNVISFGSFKLYAFGSQGSPFWPAMVSNSFENPEQKLSFNKILTILSSICADHWRSTFSYEQGTTKYHLCTVFWHEKLVSKYSVLSHNLICTSSIIIILVDGSTTTRNTSRIIMIIAKHMLKSTNWLPSRERCKKLTNTWKQP